MRTHLYNQGSMGASTRFKRLDRLDAFSKCLEYSHQETSWDGKKADSLESISPAVLVPSGFTQPDQQKAISEKRPTAPLRLTPMVIDRFTGLLFSAARLPNVTVEDDRDSQDFVQAVFKKAKFWRTMHLARTLGGSLGSVLITCQLRRKRFSFTAHSAKVIHDVVWEDPDLKIPAGVLIQYLFEKEIEALDEDGRTSGRTNVKTYVYRRIIDSEWDITFQPAEVVRGEIPAEMQIDPDASYQHRLGEFPGSYVFNLPSDDPLDGIPDCDGAFQMFETIDRQVAQSNKGLIANQDPTVVYGRDRKYEQAGIPLKKGSENALNVGLGGSATYLEMSGTGITAAGEFVKFLRQAAMDKVGAVLVDPAAISGAAQSAKSIEYIYAPMLEKADRLRAQYEDAIVQLANVVLGLARVWTDPKNYNVAVKSIRLDVPAKRIEIDSDPNNPDPKAGVQVVYEQRRPGNGTQIEVVWGPYFSETPLDRQTMVGVWTASYTAGLVDLETAVRKICAILEIDDVDGVLRRVREESASKKSSALAIDMPGVVEMPYDEPAAGPDQGPPPQPGPPPGPPQGQAPPAGPPG